MATHFYGIFSVIVNFKLLHSNLKKMIAPNFDLRYHKKRCSNLKKLLYDSVLSDYFDKLCYNHKQMPSKNTEKKLDSIRELSKNISPILVINNSSLKPYIELFNYEPENIYQKPLGNLVGFFEIKEYSEQSAYIVNFLTSVLKKEYYANPRRSVAESFDSAMHKVNLALSEVTKHGNIEWIGKLHASICVIEKNSIHFTVAGNAKIFLKRKESLTDISDGLSSDESQPHPLKTFINVSSGRLEKEDKLIITSEDIFHILKLSDLKKSFQRLSKEQFVQFLKTALSNELEMIATIVVDFEETKKIPATKKITAIEDDFQQETVNVFSQTAFPKINFDLPVEKDSNQIKEASEETDYTDKKTGHIYVQGSALPEEVGQLQHYWELTTEKISDGWYFSKTALKRNYNLQKKRLRKKIEQAQKNAQLRKEQQLEKEEELKIEQLEQLARKQQTEVVQVQAELAKENLLQQTESALEPKLKPAPKRQLTEIINLKEKKLNVESSFLAEKEDLHEYANTNEIQNTESPQIAKENQAEQATGYYLERLKPLFEKATAITITTLSTLKKFGGILFQRIIQFFKKVN